MLMNGNLSGLKGVYDGGIPIPTSFYFGLKS